MLRPRRPGRSLPRSSRRRRGRPRPRVLRCRREAPAGARSAGWRGRRGRSQRRPRQRGEVVMAEEGGLAPPGGPRLEDVRAEDLRDAGHRRRDRPGDEAAEHDVDVPPAADEERHREREQGVLGELRRRDRMCRRPVVGRPQPRIHARGTDVDQEDGARDPHRETDPKRREATPEAGRRRRQTDGEKDEIREDDVRRRGAEIDREPRLVVDVQEQDRQRCGESDRRRNRRPCSRHRQDRGPRVSARLARRGHSDGHRRPLYWPLWRACRSFGVVGCGGGDAFLSVGFGFLGTVLASGNWTPMRSVSSPR